MKTISKRKVPVKSSKWPDFLFTVAVRLVCGFILGGLACFLIFWSGILRVSAHGRHSSVAMAAVICGLVGALVAIFTIPRWQTPWYKRERSALSRLPELDFDGADQAKHPVVKKSISIKVVGADERERTYASVEELPPDLRAEIESSMREAEKANGLETSSVNASTTKDGLTISVVRRKEASIVRPSTVSYYRIVDKAGTERIYYSLDEMPPDLRAAVTDAGRAIKME